MIWILRFFYGCAWTAIAAFVLAFLFVLVLMALYRVVAGGFLWLCKVYVLEFWERS